MATTEPMEASLLKASDCEQGVQYSEAPEQPPAGWAGLVGVAANLVCQMAGLGILQLPFMLRQAGWACLGMIALCALASNYTLKLVVRCCYDEDRLRVRSSYAEIAQAAFGPAGRVTSNGFEWASLFGVSTLFLVLAGKFLEEIFDGPLGWSTRVWIGAAGGLANIPVLALGTVRELRVVALLGVTAVVLVVVTSIVVSLTTHGNGSSHSDSDRGGHSLFLVKGFPQAFAAMSLAFAAHAGIPHVEESMPKQLRPRFDAAANLAYLVVLALYLPIATVGYAVYGDEVYSPILCSLPRVGPLQIGAKSLVTLHILLTYPVLMTLLHSSLERSSGLKPGANGYLWKRTVLRVLVGAGTVGAGAAVPYFSTLMSLVGALCIVACVFVLPAAFFIKLHAKSWLQAGLPLVVAAVGTLGGGMGAYQAVQELVNEIRTHADPNA